MFSLRLILRKFGFRSWKNPRIRSSNTYSCSNSEKSFIGIFGFNTPQLAASSKISIRDSKICL